MILNLILSTRTIFPNKVTFEVPSGHVFWEQAASYTHVQVTSTHDMDAALRMGGLTVSFPVFPLEGRCPPSGGMEVRRARHIGNSAINVYRVLAHFQLFVNYRARIPVLSI